MKRILICLILLFVFLSPFSGMVRGEESGESAPPPDFRKVIAKLGSSDEAVRLRAKDLLVRIGAPAGPDLTEALAEADGKQAYDLLFVLANINYPPAADTIEEKWEESDERPVRLAAALALCRLNRNYDRYQDYILSEATTGEEKSRMSAMQVLGYIKDRRVVPPLKKIFYDSEQPDQVRQAAIWDLAHTPDEASARTMVEMVNDPEVDWFYKEILIAAIRKLAAEPGMAPVVSELLMDIEGIPRSSAGEE